MVGALSFPFPHQVGTHGQEEALKLGVREVTAQTCTLRTGNPGRALPREEREVCLSL